MNVEFQGRFFILLFSVIKRIFSSSLLSAIRVISSAYLRLLTFVPAILIVACESPSPTFCMMYSTYELNMQGDNIQLYHTPFPIFNKSIVSRLDISVVF